MIPRETVYSDGGFYEKPRWQQQAEQDNDRYTEEERDKEK